MKNTNKTGFTLIEMLVTIGILAIVVAVGGLNIVNFKSSHSFDLDAEVVVSAFRNAQNRSIFKEDGTGWGVRFTNVADGRDYFEIFSGSTYSTSTVVLRESLSAASEFANPAEGFSITTTFEALTGVPSSAQTIVLHRGTGDDIYTITLSNLGKMTKRKEIGLVGLWSFDEESGDVIYDSSKRGHNGVIVIGGSGNQITSSQSRSGGSKGRSGKSLKFDGTDDQSNLPDVGALSEGTFALWVKPSSVNANQGWIDSNFDIFQEVGSVASVRAGNEDSTGIGGWAENTWHHVAMTWDGSTFHGYIDGSLTAASGIQSGSRTGALYIARVNAGNFFDGQIDEVRVYNRALSEEEIQQLYQSY